MAYEDLFTDVDDEAATGEKNYFKFEFEGDKLIGKIVGARTRKSKQYPNNDPVPEIDVQTDDGTVYTYAAWPKIPAEELADAQRGDIVFIRYNGERPTESGRPYKHFTVSLKQPVAATATRQPVEEEPF